MSALEDLDALASQAASVLATHILALNNVDASLRNGLSVRIVRAPERIENIWLITVDVLAPGGEKSVEFTICQTGCGGFPIDDPE